LIAYLFDEPATVFGTNSSGVIALQLLIDHPQAIRAPVSFDPAALRRLPDNEKWMPTNSTAGQVLRQAAFFCYSDFLWKWIIRSWVGHRPPSIPLQQQEIQITLLSAKCGSI
jgi:pimeloyl-ACP methyl ester carboxylesterase